jgi:DNA-directed RNA polymerase specialized sigma24 family protein
VEIHKPTEAEIVSVLDNVARRLAKRFKFGYHDNNDMMQQARLFALEGLKHYDGQRPLENYLWTHVRNRLFNFKRDKYSRPNCPCGECAEDETQCIREHCTFYLQWEKRNQAKQNLMNPIDMNNVEDENEDRMKFEDDVADITYNKEIISVINNNLPLEFRHDMLRIMQGTSISKHRKDKLLLEIQKVLYDSGYEEEARSIKL